MPLKVPGCPIVCRLLHLEVLFHDGYHIQDQIHGEHLQMSRNFDNILLIIIFKCSRKRKTVYDDEISLTVAEILEKLSKLFLTFYLGDVDIFPVLE